MSWDPSVFYDHETAHPGPNEFSAYVDYNVSQNGVLEEGDDFFITVSRLNLSSDSFYLYTTPKAGTAGAGKTATPWDDFEGVEGTITFDPYQTKKRLRFSSFVDSLDEDYETINFGAQALKSGDTAYVAAGILHIYDKVTSEENKPEVSIMPIFPEDLEDPITGTNPQLEETTTKEIEAEANVEVEAEEEAVVISAPAIDVNNIMDVTVGQIYTAAFGRLPDQEGIDYWKELVEDNLIDYKSMAEQFVNSDEFQNQVGPFSNFTTFTTTLYENILDRQPDLGGLSYWTNQLGEGILDRSNVLLQFADSSESASKFIDLLSTQFL
jgi:hypothetical protein